MTNDTTDKNLDFDYESALLACARGERFGLHAIYTRDSRWLYSVILHIVRKPELADEVLQEAMLKIWRSADTYSPALGAAKGWIYTVARNQALNALRKLKNQPVQVELDVELAESLTAVEAPVGDVDPELLSKCLSALDEPKRKAIVLAFVQGFTHEQIARNLDSPLGSVKSWIRRGLIKLKECLS